MPEEDNNIIIAPKDWPTADNIIKVLGIAQALGWTFDIVK